MKKRVYVVDAMNYIFRAYHGLPANITSPKGMLTNAVLGYLRTLLRIIKEQKPEYIAAAFEKTGIVSQFDFAGVQSQSKTDAGGSGSAIRLLQKDHEGHRCHLHRIRDYEADDVIGTIATRMSALGHPIVIVTGDKDMSQLVSANGFRL